MSSHVLWTFNNKIRERKDNKIIIHFIGVNPGSIGDLVAKTRDSTDYPAIDPMSRKNRRLKDRSWGRSLDEIMKREWKDGYYQPISHQI